MKYRGIFEYEYPTEHKTPVSIDVHLHGDCVKGKIIEWEYRPLEQEPCEDVVSRAEVKRIAKEMYLEVANMKLDVNTISDCISCTSSKCREVLERKLQALPSVTPQEPRWIPVKTRKLTDAEEEDMFENSNYYYNYMFDCLLPEDGEKVLVTTSTGEVTDTTFYDEGIDGCYFEFYENEGDVIAWKPKPQPYKAKSEE